MILIFQPLEDGAGVCFALTIKSLSSQAMHCSDCLGMSKKL